MNWISISVYTIIGIVSLFCLFLVYLLLAWICKLIFYKTSYAKAITYKGEVLEMEYTPPQTHTHVHSEVNLHILQHQQPQKKNEVIIKTSKETRTIDSDKLYQRVRIGEEVTVVSQSKYIKPRYWDGNWEYDGERLIL